MATDNTRDELRRELIRQGVGVALILAASIVIDPVQRRNARLAVDRGLRSAHRWMTEPIPAPSVVEISALQQEARTITEQAAPDAH